uniref:Fatty acyl-CoA reductase n=1 Tax=Naja naja TaxID=35670 RepID=A0A8C7E3V5_NAJNA
MKDTVSLVGAYYSGKSVLVTGATGFMGKVLIEKFLHSCHDVKAIYVCVRNSKMGRNRVREELPNFHEKIKPISAEFTKPNLAISSEDMEEMLSEVNVIFHCAATVRFDEPLKDALLLNVMGTQQLLRLAHQMKNLEALIHVSTAYSNCNRRHIEEVFYPVPVEPKKLLELVWMDGSLIEAITPNLIGDWPNTYTFSKALTEYLIQQEKGDLNVAIIRPSIVGASWQEPFPGWIDNFNNISGSFVASGKGILQTVKCNPAALADIIPVDLAINLTIAAGWYTAMHRPESPLIFNCTSGNLNPLCWREIGENTFEKNPLEKPFRIPNITITSNYLVHQYWTFVHHTIPAFLCDLHLRLIGKKNYWDDEAIYCLEKAMSHLEYFTSHSWDWSSENANMLMKELNPKDKNVSIFIEALHPHGYLKCVYRFYTDISASLLSLLCFIRLKTIHCALKATLFVIIWCIFTARSKVAQNLWYFLLNLCYKFFSYARHCTLRH